MKTVIYSFFSVILLTGCIAYSAVGPGELSYGALQVQTGDAWNQAPKEFTRFARPESVIWTQNGTRLDRIMIIPAVPGGEPLFRQNSKSEALPVFESNMLPNEIEELTESSIVKLFGEGGAVVETTNLRPHRYGDNRGILFDLKIKVSNGPDYQGIVGALIVDKKLYLIFFLGAEPYYYKKYLAEALKIIESARVSTPP